MRKKIILLILIALMLISCGENTADKTATAEDKKVISTEDQIIEVFSNDTDISQILETKNYTLSYEILTPQEIKERSLNSIEYKEIYQDAPEKTLVKAIIEGNNGRGFISLIDLDSKIIIRKFGIILFQVLAI